MLMISRGNPSKRVGFPSKTVHWTVFSPHPALVDAKVFRSLRRAAKGCCLPVASVEHRPSRQARICLWKPQTFEKGAVCQWHTNKAPTVAAAKT